MLSGSSLAGARPTVLVLNIAVGLGSTIGFVRGGLFSWRGFWPLAVTSCPASFIGGSLVLASSTDRVLVCLVLLYGAIWLFTLDVNFNPEQAEPLRIWRGLALGAPVGLISGLTGIGGGILLIPAWRLANRTDSTLMRGIVSACVLVNSVAGLLPRLSGLSFMPDAILYWAPPALVGAWIGTELRDGPRRMILTHRRLLSLLLLVAAVKFLI